MATSTDGHLLKKVSTPIDRLITENYNPDPLNNWDLVNVGFLNLVLALFQNGVDADFAVILAKIAEAFDSMGVKMIRENVALTGLNSFPNIPSYIPKNKERVLLIAQTDPTQNGFYEWQTGGNLVRIWDFRDVISGNGIAITNNNLAVRLLENGASVARTDNFLQFDNAGKLFARIASNAVGLKVNENRELYIDTAEIGGGGGGGVSILDVPHPDIDSVTGDVVVLAYSGGNIIINGGNFRRDATVICEGFDSVSYGNRSHKKLLVNFTSNDLIGTHTVVVKHLILDSENTGRNKFTILGSPVIDNAINTISGTSRVKRGNINIVEITGLGFADLSVFSINNPNMSINGSVANRLLAYLDLYIPDTVPSGYYDLTCTNAYVGLGSFDSGTSGYGILEVYGDPFITTVFLSPESLGLLAEVHMDETTDIVVNGYDLTDDFYCTSPSVPGIIINSVAGSSIEKSLNVYGDNDVQSVGIKDLICNDTLQGTNSGNSGNGKIALNYPKNSPPLLPMTFAGVGLDGYGNPVSSGDWSFVNQGDFLYVYKDGGGGLCWIRVEDLFFAASLLPNFVLGKGGNTKLGFTILTSPNSLPTVGGGEGIYLAIADRGITDNNAILPNADYFMQVQKFNSTFYNYRLTNGYDAQIQDLDDVSININTNGLVTNYSFNGNINNFSRTHTSHTPQTLYIGMDGAYEIKINFQGFVGGF